ncbi:unnamed protein product [Prorocentrum cordatum]|uniref:Non-specific serine/threonine protein kinase n=1 Tax=Prorocentrum cordatum TaxID=2364126 RepID=A0ABN9X863_9DINO|nr:unnamed protein product [Polarella glacialis]
MQKTGAELVGSMSFMSINAHHRLEQSRRDDIEAIGHMLVYFMGKLPWADVESLSQEEKSRRILEQKELHTGAGAVPRAAPPDRAPPGLSQGPRLHRAPGDYWDLGTRFSTVRKQMGMQHHQFTWLAGSALGGTNPAGLDPLLKPQHPRQPDDQLVARSTTLLSSFSRRIYKVDVLQIDEHGTTGEDTSLSIGNDGKPMPKNRGGAAPAAARCGDSNAAPSPPFALEPSPRSSALGARRRGQANEGGRNQPWSAQASRPEEDTAPPRRPWTRRLQHL